MPGKIQALKTPTSFAVEEATLISISTKVTMGFYMLIYKKKIIIKHC